MKLYSTAFSLAPLLVGTASTQNGSTGATLTISKPTGTTQNNLMIAIMVSGNDVGTTWTGDTGWTEIKDQNASPDLRIAYKIAGASEGDSYTFTNSSSADYLSGCILTYRNAAYDTIGTVGTATSGGNCTAAQITVANNMSILIAAFANDRDSVTFPTPAGMSAVISDSGANSPSYAIFSQLVNAGASGTKSSDCSGSSGYVAGVLLSIY